MKNRLMVVLILSALFISISPIEVIAAEFQGIETIGYYEIPSDFEFRSSDVCAKHEFFYQVSVRDDGWFAVYYRHADTNTIPEEVFYLAHIDIFDSEGIFQQEFSFYSQQDCAVEFTENEINLYFYNSVISYNLETGDLLGYSIPAASAIENGLYSRLRRTNFYVGEWHFECIKALHGYTKLIREKDGITQILLSLPGSGYSIWNTALSAIAIGFIGLGTVSFWKNHLKSKHIK